MHEAAVLSIRARTDQHVLDRAILAAQPRGIVARGIAAREAGHDRIDHILVDVELGNVMADVLALLVAEHLELGPGDPLDDAVRPDPVQADRGVLEDVAQVLLAALERTLRQPPLRHVAEDQHAPGAVDVADRCGTVVDGSLRAVPGDEDRMVGQTDDGPLAQTLSTGLSTRSRVCSSTMSKTAVSGRPSGLAGPAGQLAATVQEGDSPAWSVVITASPMLASVTRSASRC